MAQEIDWDRLDKKKFFYYGLGLFSGVTTCLYPLSVIKTRQMASSSIPSGLSGTAQTARDVWRRDGIRGFYRGYGTVLLGTIPVRVLYLNSLEITKSSVYKVGQRLDLAPTTQATLANAAGGAAASLVSQLVGVPVDVVTQRLMVAGGRQRRAEEAAAAAAPPGAAGAGPSSSQQQRQPGAAAAGGAGGGGSSAAGTATAAGSADQRRSFGSGAANRAGTQGLAQHQQQQQPRHRRGLASGAAPASPPMSGLGMARHIVANEGVAGLYRGFLPSMATYVPNSAVWWGAYGFWQKQLWLQRARWGGGDGSGGGGPVTSEVVAVQTAAALLSGLSSSVLTNPMDVLKTRLQVTEVARGEAAPTWGGTLRRLLREEGPRGLLRGVAPRMASSALWGTAMVSTLEALKRWCVLPDAAGQEEAAAAAVRPGRQQQQLPASVL